jgi:hypothetical protein
LSTVMSTSETTRTAASAVTGPAERISMTSFPCVLIRPLVDLTRGGSSIQTPSRLIVDEVGAFVPAGNPLRPMTCRELTHCRYGMPSTREMRHSNG